MLYKEFHTDTGWTVAIADNGHVPVSVEEFLTTGKKALTQGINAARIGNTVGHISKAIQSTVEGDGYNLVPSLVGHGIGKTLHEPPQIPNVLRGEMTGKPALQDGMTIAIEPIYVQGKPGTVRKKDGWTVVTVDNKLAGQFEHTIAVPKKGPIRAALIP